MNENLTTRFNEIFDFLLSNHTDIWGVKYDIADPGAYPLRIIKNLAEAKHLSSDGRYIKFVYAGHRHTEVFPVMTCQLRYFGGGMEPVDDLLNDTRLESAVNTLETCLDLLYGAGTTFGLIPESAVYTNLQLFEQPTPDGATYALTFDVKYY